MLLLESFWPQKLLFSVLFCEKKSYHCQVLNCWHKLCLHWILSLSSHKISSAQQWTWSFTNFQQLIETMGTVGICVWVWRRRPYSFAIWKQMDQREDEFNGFSGWQTCNCGDILNLVHPLKEHYNSREDINIELVFTDSGTFRILESADVWHNK